MAQSDDECHLLWSYSLHYVHFGSTHFSSGFDYYYWSDEMEHFKYARKQSEFHVLQPTDAPALRRWHRCLVRWSAIKHIIISGTICHLLEQYELKQFASPLFDWMVGESCWAYDEKTMRLQYDCGTDRYADFQLCAPAFIVWKLIVVNGVINRIPPLGHQSNLHNRQQNNRPIYHQRTPIDHRWLSNWISEFRQKIFSVAIDFFMSFYLAFRCDGLVWRWNRNHIKMP